MNKVGAILLALLVALSGAMTLLINGCSSGPAYGKLQIMYSGNVRGNVAPCG